MKKLYLFFLFIAIGKISSGQFNDSTHHYVKYSATGIVNRTNDIRSFIVNNAFVFSVHKKKVDLTSTNAWVYGRQNRVLTNNDFSSVLNLDLLKNLQRLYYWGILNYVTSYSLKINHQFQGGAGLGYTVAKGEKFHFVVSDGILYETNDLDDPVIGHSKYQTFRNSLRIKLRCIVANTITFESTDFWQPSLSSFDDYIIQSATSLSLKIRKWLSITSSLTYNRFSRTHRENLLVTFGLTAEKYF
jgi:hypothetical protein